MFGTSGILAPMLAHSIEKPFDSPDYLFEPKWDGFRCISYLQSTGVRLFSRNQKELTEFFPELSELHRLLSGSSAVLDGEIVTLVDGLPNFQLLLKRMRNARGIEHHLSSSQQHPAVYIVFDLLSWNGKDLMPLPLAQRKALLQQAVQESQHCVITNYVIGQGIALYEAAKKQKLEGIVAKRLNSIYTPGNRSRNWLKCKIVRSVDACVVGFIPKEQSLSSLALAVYKTVHKKPHLYYIGHVGTGISEDEATSLRQFLSQYICPKTVLNIANMGSLDRLTIWVHPKIVCQVDFLELTPEHKLRHPSFAGIRFDKRPEECTWEQLTQ